jgi:N6-adenosine-specific RNA methylase IME4
VSNADEIGQVQVWPLERLRLHEQAGVVPAMSEEEYRPFREDVRRRDVLVPIDVTREGVLLDGRQRFRAAGECGIGQVPVRVVAPADEVDYMLRAAVLRRQLSPSQRAALAVELGEYTQLREQARERRLANLQHGVEVASVPPGGEVAGLPPRGKTREVAATWAGVSPRTLQDVATVQEHDPVLFERVKAGEVKAAQAARRVRRRLRDAALPASPPLPQGPFEIVYADPPWQLGNPGGEFAPENHYPTMPIVEICELAVPAADCAVLFLWAVNSLLPQALQVLNAWGFTYKAHAVWVKPSIGPGVWFRPRAELLLLGVRGGWPPPDPEERCDSVIEAARGRHSEKPGQAYALIERMYPAASKLELFARGPARPGWAAWGNEAEPTPGAGAGEGE